MRCTLGPIAFVAALLVSACATGTRPVARPESRDAYRKVELRDVALMGMHDANIVVDATVGVSARRTCAADTSPSR